MKRFIVLCLLAVLTPLMCISAAYGQVETLIINELMASNGDTLRDEDGDSPDWIELYNPTNQVINLGGYGITDSTKKEPWTFPDIQIQPKSYLVIYASGKDRVTKIGSTTHIHTDFSLSIEGEQIFLFNKEGRIIDYVRFPQQYRDVSYGRTESGEWRFFSEPTPGSSNESTPTLGISQKPSVSEDSKVFSEPFYLTLDATEGATIYYAFGGEEPKLSSHVYTEPILIDMTTVIRGMAVEPGKEPSPSFTRTFLYDEDYNISVISIAVEDFLFEDTGIWLNKDARGEEWERPAAVSFFEADGTLGFHYEDDLGIRVHGGASRSYEKSSLRLYWRNQTALEYSLFPNKPELDWFKRIILRCGGQDLIHWDGSLLRCAVFSELWRQIGGLVSSYHPVVVLINEHNWGMYVLRERIDKYYLASNYGVDPDNVDLLKMEMWGILTLKEGDMDEWNRMFRFFETSDFTDPEVYKKATEMIDIANFTDYTIFQIYAGNFDWPHNNIYMFRERTEGAKWRFVMWDLDDAFNLRQDTLHHNTLEWATRDRPRYDLTPWWIHDGGGAYLYTTLMLRKFLENPEYREYFIKRTDEILNTILHPDHVIAEIEKAAAWARPGVKWEVERWGTSVEQWERAVEIMKDSARRRPEIMREHYRNYFKTNSI